MELDLLKLKSEYLEYVKATLSDGTYRCYYYHLNSIINYFINNNLEINKKNLVIYIQECKEKLLANKTINHRVLTLKCMLKYADIDIGMPSEYMRRVGQSIAAASLSE